MPDGDVTGRFIVFEGGEGSGKSTQAALLAERLGARLTHEPGGTSLGLKLRELLLDASTTDLDVRAEALLMAADRAQHVAEVVAPSLAAGHDVVCDRFIGSSLAYQGYGRGLELGVVEGLSAFAAGGLEPDVVILLDVPGDVGHRRRSGRADRIEGATGGFHERVRDGYLALAADRPDRWVVIDGTGSVDQVAASVRAAVEGRVGTVPP